MNQYAENTHAQFGNVRSCREIASLANQLDRSRTLVEIYGAGGWDLRFEDMKRIGDWLLVLGVNTLDEHLSYITLRGARKRDHPQSFSYHEPWWPHYGALAQYFTRLSAALTQGQQVNPVLVLEPTTTAWMHQGHDRVLKPLGDDFFSLLMRLERAQVEYDLGCEDVLAREGSVAAPSFSEPPARTTLRVGHRSYPVVVLPSHTENFNTRTAELLKSFLAAGGTVLSCGPAPSRLDGRETTELSGWASEAGWKQITEAQIVEALDPFRDRESFRIEREPQDAGILFHHRRRLDDGELLFLVNTSLEAPSRGVVSTQHRGVEHWDPRDGSISPAPFESQEAGVRVRFDLPPCGSQLLFLSDRRVKSPQTTLPALSPPVTLPTPLQVTRLQPNVLTLDTVDITAGGDTLSNAYFYAAQQFAFRQNGMARNPWDSAVQFREELISRAFPPDSGFTASYHFTVAGAVPSDLEVVIERPDLYTISCNGQSVAPTPDAWWLDRAFGRIPLAQVAQTGINTLTLVARPFTIEHELEPAYVRGSFSLQPTHQGFIIGSDRGLTCSTQGWNEQGHPFYGGEAAYRQTLVLDKKPKRTWVLLPSWYGSVATVSVNGKACATLVSEPWETEITHNLKRGPNTIEVVIAGTLKNTLGPHHGKPGRGSAWPGMFQRGPEVSPAPGSDYDTIAYGLFEPLQIREAVDR